MTIKNLTINKLTNAELDDLGCFGIGIMLYAGQLKTMVKGFKTCSLDGNGNISFENEMEDYRHEFIKTLDGYAYRIYDQIRGEYFKQVQPTEGLIFIR